MGIIIADFGMDKRLQKVLIEIQRGRAKVDMKLVNDELNTIGEYLSRGIPDNEKKKVVGPSRALILSIKDEFQRMTETTSYEPIEMIIEFLESEFVA